MKRILPVLRRLRPAAILVSALATGFLTLAAPELAAASGGFLEAPQTTAAPIATPGSETAVGEADSRLALALETLAAYDGSPEAPPASRSRWLQSLHDLRRGNATAWPNVGTIRERAAPWPDVETIRARAASVKEGMPIPIAVLDRTSGPGEAPLFLAAALRERSGRGARVEFVVDSDLWFGDASPDRDRLEIDFDDGRGWHRVALGTRVAAGWSSPGPKAIRLRATSPRDAGADARVATFPFEVRALGTPAPSDTLRIVATEPYLGATASADAYVYLADGHTSIENPVIVIEGFDLEDTFDWEELYELLNQESLLETMRARGFDAIVVNFDDATDHLQRNAFVVVEAIETVNALSAGPGDVALVGASMGGLLSRFALAWMEQQARPTNVRTFLSFDAPQKGANIPLGIQHWLTFFEDDSADAAFLLSRLDRPAARAMLLYHHREPPTGFGEADPLRTEFLADLAALGEWPTGPRLAAVANGSGTGAHQGFLPGDQIIEWEYFSFLVDVIGNVWAVPDGAATTIFEGELDIIFLPSENSTVAVSGTSAWDSAPGGFRRSMATMDSVAAPFGDIVALHDAHGFIPTISALALDTEDPFFAPAGAGDILAMTPFDAVLWPNENQLHVSVDATSVDWILDEIAAGATSVGGLPPAVGSASLRLLPGGPNPFRSATTIRFALDSPRRVTVDVHGVAGRLVTRLLDDAPLSTGSHAVRWAPGADRVAAAAGIYWVRISTDDDAPITQRAVRLR